MRVAVVVLLLLGALSGCGARPVAAGCGLVDAAAVRALAGARPTARLHGSVAALRRHGTPLRCTTRSAGRGVDIRAVRHPAPMRLPHRRCAEGWVYAGTADHYFPACQIARGRAGTTLLLRRDGSYVITVAVRRPDHAWAGDAEEALAIADQLAGRLS